MPFLQIPPLPPDTARAAEHAFGREHICLRIGRELEALLAGFETPGLPAHADIPSRIFWPYSLASILQYWEDLTDSQMNRAARSRLDLKYALHLPLDFPGFELTALCTFRHRLVADPIAKIAFEDMVLRLKPFFPDPAKQAANGGEIISALCLLARAELILQTMSNALEAIAAQFPDWLIAVAKPHWYARYSHKTGPHHLPREANQTRELLQSVGEDGQYLLQQALKSDRDGLAVLPEVFLLCQEWQRQFRLQGEAVTLFPSECASCNRHLPIAPGLIHDHIS